MIPRVKPEGMLFGKPLHTFPDHALGRLRVRRHFEHAIDIEDDHELAVEAMDAAGDTSEDRAMIGIRPRCWSERITSANS